MPEVLSEGSALSGRLLLECWRLVQQEVKLRQSSLEGVAREILNVTFASVPGAVLANLWKQGQAAQRRREKREEVKLMTAWRLWQHRLLSEAKEAGKKTFSGRERPRTGDALAARARDGGKQRESDHGKKSTVSRSTSEGMEVEGGAERSGGAKREEGKGLKEEVSETFTGVQESLGEINTSRSSEGNGSAEAEETFGESDTAGGQSKETLGPTEGLEDVASRRHEEMALDVPVKRAGDGKVWREPTKKAEEAKSPSVLAGEAVSVRHEEEQEEKVAADIARLWGVFEEVERNVEKTAVVEPTEREERDNEEDDLDCLWGIKTMGAVLKYLLGR